MLGAGYCERARCFDVQFRHHAVIHEHCETLAALAHRLLRGTAAPYAAAGAGAFQRLWEQPARYQDGDGDPGDAATMMDAVLARAMSWQPDRRFDSVASFIYAFEAALSPPPAPAAGMIPAPAPVVARPAPEPRPSPPPAAVVARAVPPTAAAPSSLAPSLTQQFFAEGDRQEAETLAQQAHAPAPSARSSVAAAAPEGDQLEDAAASGTFERLPRRRAPLLAAAVLALVALAIIARAAIGTAHDDAAAWARAGAAALPVARRPPPVAPAPGPTVAPAAMPAPNRSLTATAPPPAPAPSAPRAPALTPAPGHPGHARGAAPLPHPRAAVPVTPAPLPPAPAAAAAPAAPEPSVGGGVSPQEEADEEDLSPAPVPTAESPGPEQPPANP